ncbi:hypothetical protein DL766_005724 [Monosporascus sp. MC13-8B]|uniref:C2H2-type domain-containing protein n=1 Tax=Monosporascus cannonballus TaxID=155416 RepID=A0ABY0H632_9PEZI|nr:hypothetical protein DL762_005161 [Monosporascus cannonballus]RYO97193.1 hypothetical protein DL763_002854 [Monosporascus cannonballus]RYP28708.1 hypothetical protein DL766_005724 [Monosporascus sp. MC13-8B]
MDRFGDGEFLASSAEVPGRADVQAARTGEHLYRKHAAPRRSCNRCLSPFKSASELLRHQRSAQACIVVPDSQSVGIMTTAQREKIRSKRKAKPSVTEEEKWVAIYRILFPNEFPENVPSPYYDLSNDPAIILQPGASPNSDNFFRQHFEELLKTGLPLDIEQSFEGEIRTQLSSGDGYEDMVRNIVGAARRLPLRLFQRYEQQRGARDVEGEA